MHRSTALFFAFFALTLVGCPEPAEPEPTGEPLGGACTSPADCADGLSCHLGFPGGACVSACEAGCAEGGACASWGGDSWCLGGCSADTDCREGYYCNAGACAPPCRATADCAEGAQCQGGRCQFGAIGAACQETMDCAEGLTCAKALPSGYCTRTCGAGDPCPSGTECVVWGGEGICFDQCSSHTDCRYGYSCHEGVCDKPCDRDADCGGGEICDELHRCVGAGVGQPCALGSDCADGLSCDAGVPGGYCTQACSSAGDCPVGSACAHLGDGDACLAACRIDADCSTGQACQRGLCRLPCTGDPDCADNEFCDAATGMCRRNIASGDEFQVLDLGTLPSQRAFTVGVDDQTWSMTLVVHGVNPDARYMVVSARSPSGEELVAEDGFSGPLRTLPETEIAMAQIPNSDDPAIAVRPGTWTFGFASDDGSSADVTVMLKKSETGTETGGFVPLNIYIAPQAFGPAVNASNAASNSHMRGTLDRWRVFYREQADVSLDEVRYFDIDGQYTDISSEAEYEEMFARYGQDDALNMFFVRSITLYGQSGVAGVAGGIPGAPRIGFTRHSGVVIEVQDTARLTGDDMCHEAGHFQGLFHTTESDERTHDLLSDTPECGSIYSCYDSYRHLMFPMLTGQADRLSPASAKVVRAHAGVH